MAELTFSDLIFISSNIGQRKSYCGIATRTSVYSKNALLKSASKLKVYQSVYHVKCVFDA